MLNSSKSLILIVPSSSEDFQKLEEIEHHGITRYEHSLKVSYYAYKISKFLRFGNSLYRE